MSNTQCKISIDNVSRKTDTLGNAYFQFDVLVRKINDSDKNGQVIYERFSACNLIDLNWVKPRQGSPVIGKTIRELQIRSKTGVTVVAVMRDVSLQMNPGPDYRFQPDDLVGVISEPHQLDSFLQLTATPSL